MNINFEYDNVSASERLEALATEKINKLVNKYDFIVRADVFLKQKILQMLKQEEKQKFS